MPVMVATPRRQPELVYQQTYRQPAYTYQDPQQERGIILPMGRHLGLNSEPGEVLYGLPGGAYLDPNTGDLVPPNGRTLN